MSRDFALPAIVNRFAWIAVTTLLSSIPAHAVPSFARQTGFECVNCHLSWPELTPLGREFKLGGYTLTKEANGERPLFSFKTDSPPRWVPVAAMLQLSLTNTRSTADADPSQFPRNNDVVLQQASLCRTHRRSPRRLRAMDLRWRRTP